MFACLYLIHRWDAPHAVSSSVSAACLVSDWWVMAADITATASIWARLKWMQCIGPLFTPGSFPQGWCFSLGIRRPVMIRATSDSSRWMTLKRCCVLCFSLLLNALPTMAADGFWEDRQRGYYWYEDPVLEKPQEAEIEGLSVIMQSEGKNIPDNYNYDDLFDLHPDRFKVVIDARLKSAVHRPTEENVLRFLEATDVAKKKSRTMANVAGYVAMQNPRLTGESRYPYSQPGRNAYLAQRSHEIKTNLANFRDRYAIIVFNQKGCGYCESQEDILARFESLNRWPVRRIDINENPALAARFRVDITPTLLLVSRDTQESQIISAGVIALDQLNKRIYRLVRLMEGATDPEQFYNMDFNAALTPKGNKVRP